MIAERVSVVAGAKAPQMPVTLEQVKAHLRVTEDHEDELLRMNLLAAVDWAEEVTRRAIAQRSYLIKRDAFPSGAWGLPLGRIKSVTAVRYIDADGVKQTWTASPLPYETSIDTNFRPRIRPKDNESWPSTGAFLDAAEIEVVAGWDSSDVPYTVRAALLLKVAEMHESRAPGDEAVPGMSTADSAAQIMLSTWTLSPWL